MNIEQNADKIAELRNNCYKTMEDHYKANNDIQSIINNRKKVEKDWNNYLAIEVIIKLVD